MQFETFKTRRVTLKKAEGKDLREYELQALKHIDAKPDKLNIIKAQDTFYLKIENEDGKMLGLIQVDEIDKTAAYVKISVPNKSREERYGKEALHQFIKCCKERKLYPRVYFKRGNRIIEEYKKERPDVLSRDFYIDIDVA